jgi:hypothetical protein
MSRACCYVDEHLLRRALPWPVAARAPALELTVSACEATPSEEARVPRISAFYGIVIYMY